MALSVTSADPATTVHHSGGGADLLGWSALPLLGRFNGHGPWLFVLESSAWLSRGPLSQADFRDVAVNFGGTWPLGNGTLGGIVIDGDALARRQNRDGMASVLREACRTAGPEADVLIVCRHRYLPRLSAWREYGRPSAERWRRAASQAGVRIEQAGFATLDGDRITALERTLPDTAATGADVECDRVVLRVAPPRLPHDDVVGRLIEEVSSAIARPLQTDRIGVRKIGKTAVFLSDPDGARYVLRIARSPIALARARRNFETLRWLQESTLPDALKGRAPLAVAHGVHAGYEYFVETALPGGPGPVHVVGGAPGGWPMEAVRYISELHRLTAQRGGLDDATMNPLVREPIARLARACGAAASAPVFARLGAVCETALRDRVLPLVQTHGDYTESNCLFDSDGHLTGVVDWEVALRPGLPLIDLLQLMPVAGENSSAPRWQRFDQWMTWVEKPELAVADPVVGEYVRDLDVPAAAIPALVLMQWVIHVEDRVAARRDDERWMRLRVHQPLESVRRILCG